MSKNLSTKQTLGSSILEAGGRHTEGFEKFLTALDISNYLEGGFLAN
jgi:hypothetical protein